MPGASLFISITLASLYGIHHSKHESGSKVDVRMAAGAAT